MRFFGRKGSEGRIMTSAGLLQIAIFFGLILVCAKPLGAYMARVVGGQRTFMHPLLRWLEVVTCTATGVREDVEKGRTQCTSAMFSLSLFGCLLTYFMEWL